ncbi:alkaline phosphatase family protein [Bartonella sp. LJL80]
MSKVILIVLDGLRYDTARECLGYPEAMVRQERGHVFKLQSELPAISRPLYETILTGRTPVDHGVVSNTINRRSNGESVFSLARQAGLVTAAAAYHWVSELYVSSPFNPQKDRLLINGNSAIQHGMFYWEDTYPDSHLFADAQTLLDRFSPHFLLLHPMNIDDSGHKNGGNSPSYRNKARNAADLLAQYMPQWLEDGYKIIVTADHGMGDDGNHAGPLPSESEVPFYTFGFKLSDPSLFSQTQIADLCCQLLGIESTHMAPFEGNIM